MGKGLASLLIPAAAIGATVLTGGAAAPALAGAAGATGAGAAATTGAGLGLAGDALAAQGATGLLGGAGAAAAGYGAGVGTAASALGTGAASEGLGSGMASYGPNGEYVGNTIASDGLSANSFTGGYDALNPLQRAGQRLGGMDFDGKGMQIAQKGMGMMQGGQPQQGQIQNAPPAAPMQRPQQQAGSFVDSNNMSPEELEMLKRKSWLENIGRA